MNNLRDILCLLSLFWSIIYVIIIAECVWSQIKNRKRKERGICYLLGSSRFFRTYNCTRLQVLTKYSFFFFFLIRNKIFLRHFNRNSIRMPPVPSEVFLLLIALSFYSHNTIQCERILFLFFISIINGYFILAKLKHTEWIFSP